MKVEIYKNSLVTNGKKMMLRAGELHYSRVSRNQWANRLLRMRQAGLNTISTYFIWNWHELEEGAFDFDGRTHPQRDIEHFLDLIGESGLMLISRQGPWACAEWFNGGYPQWLFDKHPEIMSLDCASRVTSRLELHAPVVSYLHPVYLDYVKKWYDAFFPILKRFDEKYPDRLLMIQADNETSYGFHTSPFDTDYNPVNVGSKNSSVEGLYHKWLRRKYGDISTLNKYRGIEYSSFVEIEPPRSQPKNKGQLLSVFDWTAFKEDVIVEFLQRLAKMIREHGFKVPVCVNELPVTYGNPSSIYKKSRDFFVGIDMYPSILKDALDITGKIVDPIEIFKAQSTEKYPASLEFQGGWYGGKIPLNTTQLHQRLGFAHGLKGLSYYMWVGGTNPKGWGTTGDSYDYDCAIQEDGRDGRRLPVMKRFLDFSRANEETILESEKSAEIGISYYQPYMYWCASLNPRMAGLVYNIASEESRFPNLETVLQTIGFNYEYFDLEHIDAKAVSRYKLLLVPLYDFLDAKSQKSLLDLARSGATILIGPMLPYLGGNMEPCTILGDELGIRVREIMEANAVELEGSGNIVVSRVAVLSGVSGALPIAKVSSTGQVCGYMKTVGNGKIVVLGFLPLNLRDVTAMDVLLNFFSSMSVKPLIHSNQRNVNIVERVAPDGSALLYVSNLSSENKETTVKFADPSNAGKAMEILGVVVSKRSAIVWPINLKTKLGIIKYLTSEITEIEDKNGEIVVHAWGYLDTNGKAVVKLEGTKEIHERSYEHKLEGVRMEFRSDKGAIVILIEGISSFSDLP